MFNTESIILLIIALLANTGLAIANNQFAKKVSKTGSDLYFFMLVYSLVCVAVLSVAMGGDRSFSAFSVIMGVVFGIICVAQMLFNLKALALGPFAYTAVITSLSTVIPTLSGYFWGETISLMQWIGIVLVMICIVLSPASKKDDKEKKMSGKWIAVTLITTVLGGVIGIVQKLHQTYDNGIYKDEKLAFLATSFLTVALVCGAIIIMRKVQTKNGEDSRITFQFKPMHILIYVGSGIFIGINHSITLVLAGALNSAVLFPIRSVGTLVFSALAAIIIFRERLSLKRWIGIAIGVVAVLFLSGAL